MRHTNLRQQQQNELYWVERRRAILDRNVVGISTLGEARPKATKTQSYTKTVLCNLASWSLCGQDYCQTNARLRN